MDRIVEEEGEEESEEIDQRVKEKKFKTATVRLTPELYSRRKNTK
jgi:hypothetical protein